MTHVSLRYLDDSAVVASARHTLGVVALSGFASADLPIGLELLPVPSGGLREVWQADEPIAHRGTSNGIRFACTNGLVFGMLQQDISDSGTEAAGRLAYQSIFDLIEQQGCPHLLRISNYLPGITHIEDGRERYRAFNAGRQAAFAARFRTNIQGPAACGLGCSGDAIRLFFLAGNEPGYNLENPRQVSAFDYPDRYGASRPIFARATLAAGRLFISGTASIVGHESRHISDAGAQTDEIVRNIDALLGEAARSSRHVSRGDLQLKVYLRHPRDLAVVGARITAAGFALPAAFLQADICRPELDVEIEAHA